jgi:hypothetical protein
MDDAPMDDVPMAPQEPQSTFKKGKKKWASKNGGTTIRKSIAQLRSELRGAERLLKKKGETCNAKDKLQMERKIAALKYQLEREQICIQDKSLVEKYDTMYRAVKFFERQKTIRKIKSFKRNKASESQIQVENQEANLKQALLDLCYVIHFPPATKYISLYPKDPLSPSAQAKRQEIQDKINHLIECGVIDPNEAFEQCSTSDPKEKKKTKRKGPTEEETKRKEIGNLLRGVAIAKDVPAVSADLNSEEVSGLPEDDFFMEMGST